MSEAYGFYLGLTLSQIVAVNPDVTLNHGARLRHLRVYREVTEKLGSTAIALVVACVVTVYNNVDACSVLV